MTLQLWLAYTGVIAALIAIPGPSALISMTHGLRYGRKQALATVTGGVLAAMMLMTASALGLGAILAASTTAFTVLKVVGAAYLIWLGIAAWRDNSEPTAVNATEMEEAPGAFRLFRKGFMVGISNPKDLLFFAALFPNFIDASQPHAMQFATLAITWAVLDLSIMFSYACAGRRLSGVFSNARRLRILNRSTGSLFVFAGGALAISAK
ncbi:LysE family translocator [Erwinia sorbitola]|uniref:LysE family translocator n=1 Tax=Erwinia sorbitola TaxID=2681984 RepID=A0A6I6F5P2_9GAMM|nr:LysE family transporter [Erwinia sorbitola]MTD29050.1 LysE family translocator [Erwinia sorbitola]QGU89210.1 LysE family translocator [Erwinia sorbitola]